MFCRKGVLNTFAKLTGKHLCQSLFFNKVLLKKRLWHRCFLVNFSKFLRTPFFTEHLWRLLLHTVVKLPTTAVTFQDLYLDISEADSGGGGRGARALPSTPLFCNHLTFFAITLKKYKLRY